MKKRTSKETASLKKSLSKMKWWAKEKERRYKIQRRIAEKAFGKLVKELRSGR